MAISPVQPFFIMQLLENRHRTLDTAYTAARDSQERRGCLDLANENAALLLAAKRDYEAVLAVVEKLQQELESVKSAPAGASER